MNVETSESNETCNLSTIYHVQNSIRKASNYSQIEITFSYMYFLFPPVACCPAS